MCLMFYHMPTVKNNVILQIAKQYNCFDAGNSGGKRSYSRRILFTLCIKLFGPCAIYITHIHFHWIPGQIDNKFHNHVDSLATNALKCYNSYTLSIQTIFKNITDALASGEVNHH